MELTERQQKIIRLITDLEQLSISQIRGHLGANVSQPTLNRDLAKLVKNNILEKIGSGRAIVYKISSYYNVFSEIDIDSYFQQDPDRRNALLQFNYEVFSVLNQVEIFTPDEKELLQSLRTTYMQNRAHISTILYKKEMERLTIELSWKSAQIEGNTYSLLETEKLFLERVSAQNKSREEAIMLLNHKNAMDFLLQQQDLAKQLSLRTIEEVHSILIKDMAVDKNIRTHGVGVTGTPYRPLDNEFQIKESIQAMCDLINAKENGFEKALLAIVLISYIQPFEDGNKRTARMIGNALLMAYDACPLSYRSVDSMAYKKAVLLFYEQNKLLAFKQLFIEQNEFGVRNYFN